MPRGVRLTVRLALLIVLSSCAVIDKLDGHVDNLDHCCVEVTAERVRACVARLHERIPGKAFCSVAYCEPPIDDVETYVDEHGGVHDACPATW